MSTLVKSESYVSNRGRKPSRPAFYYAFHNDDDAGTSVVDRFGNARALALQGTLGTSWSDKRGLWLPNGTDQYAIVSATGTGEDTVGGENYGAQTVIADALLTEGNGLFVSWIGGWNGTYNSSTESILCLGRSATSSAAAVMQVACNASTGAPHITCLGVGASITTITQIGDSAAASTSADNSFSVLLTATATGFTGLAWTNGVLGGPGGTFDWTANGGTKPARSVFAMPDGITVGARRGGTNPASPTFTTQRIGAGTSGNSRISDLLCLNMGTASASVAADLAMELHQYRRNIAEILAGL